MAHRTRRLNSNKVTLLLFICPFVVMVLVFNYIPILGWSYAFVDYIPGVSVGDSNFTGLKYFSLVFSKISNFWLVLRNTLCISFINIGFSVVPPIFAIMLSQISFTGYSRAIQTLTAIPHFISWVLVYSVLFFMVASQNSALNKILLSINVISKPVSILTNVRYAWLIQAFITLWKNTGYQAIIYLAAISGIDQELYQAADVDGASNRQKIFHVTVPGISSTYFVLLLLAIANMLSNGFEQYWLFGNGLTWDALEVFDTYVYRMGIQKMEFSFSIAMGIFKTIVSIILLTLANMASKIIREEAIF